MIKQPRPSKVVPHPFDPDRSVPANHRGQQFCRACQLAGAAGDVRHPTDGLPPTPAAATEIDARVLGERRSS